MSGPLSMTNPLRSAGPAGRTLGLFAKEPVPGRVKTRLVAGSSPEWAAAVARAFLEDLVERLSQVAARRVLAFAPPEGEPFFSALVQGRFSLTPQADGDLGRRMAAFFAEQFRSGAGAVVLVGADSPTLPTAFVEQAFTELEHADVVLGPATDGGYYLVGCAGRLPPIFDGPAWGSRRVLAETIDRLADPSWRLALLPPWYDIDTIEDWWVLRGHVAALRKAGTDPGVPHLEQLLRSFPCASC
jgi:rSAM/selenodomain-associated transferase 1